VHVNRVPRPDEGRRLQPSVEPTRDDHEARGLVVLRRDHCMRLLRLGGVGRIAVPGERVPTIRPVNFALQGERIVMRTSDRALWAAAEARVDAAFEFDEVRNEDHWTWNVIVTGPMRELAADASVKSWAPSAEERSLELRITDVSGRQVPDLHAVADPPPPTPLAVGSDVGASVDADDDDGVDRWGRSERARAVLRALGHPWYRYWFRFRFENLDRIPRQGGAMLVANHAGLVPVDAALVVHGIERELRRPVYGLHHHGLAAVPGLGVLLERLGGVVAHPDNALRILRDDAQLVLVFPEGTKGTGKLYRDRYRLARFGRGGFVATAMGAGVPVIPVAIVGAEETMPIVARLPGGVPLTLNALMFGPYGAGVQLPSAITARVLEPVTFDQPPGLERYPAEQVTDGAALIRARVQAAVDEMVAARARRR
jgi:1-acyl-sn-glycerol-3-phosphate acyltransferase